MILLLIFLIYIIFNINYLNLDIVLYGSMFFIIYYFIVYLYHKAGRKINNNNNNIKGFEIKYSIISLIIYMFIISGVFYLYNIGIINFSFYFGPEIILYLIGFTIYHDAYFYFGHRFMHIPLVYRYSHIQHHKSKYSNIISAYNFGIIETFIYAGAIFPIFIFDINIYAFLGAVFINDFLNIIGHSGYEIFSKEKSKKNELYKFILITSYHDLHHTSNKGNYALYFSYLDKLFGTYDKNNNK